MFYCSFPSMFQNWLYFNYLSTQMSTKIPSVEQTALENKSSPDNTNQTRSRRGSNQFQPIIVSPIPINSKVEEKMVEDDEYCPDENKTKKIRKNRQDQNRNVIPNTIHQIISFIQKKNKSGKILDQIFQKYQHDPLWTTKRYYIYQTKLKEKINHYVNEDTLSIFNQLFDEECHVYSESEQRFYLKITRVLIHYFLNHQSSIIVLTSKRMNHNKKKDHLKVRRIIEKKLRQIYNSH